MFFLLKINSKTTIFFL